MSLPGGLVPSVGPDQTTPAAPVTPPVDPGYAPIVEWQLPPTSTDPTVAPGAQIYSVWDPLAQQFIALPESPSTGPIQIILSDGQAAIMLPIAPPDSPSSIAMNMVSTKSASLGTMSFPYGTTPITVKWQVLFPGIGSVGTSFAPYASLWTPPMQLREQLEIWVRGNQGNQIPLTVIAPGIDCPSTCWLKQIDWAPSGGAGDLPVTIYLEEYRPMVAQALVQTTAPQTAVIPGATTTSPEATGASESAIAPAATAPSLTGLGAANAGAPTQPLPPPAVANSAVVTGNAAAGAAAASLTTSPVVSGNDAAGQAAAATIVPGQAVATAAAAGTKFLTYTIRPNDTLQGISSIFYGTPNYWTSVWASNTQMGPDPEALYTGEVLVIPTSPSLPPSTSGPGPLTQASGSRATGAAA